MPLLSINPANNEVLNEFIEHSPEEIEEFIQCSDKAFQSYRLTTFAQRKKWLKKTAKILRARKNELGALATMEMGKPILQSYAEIEKCAWVCDYYADNGKRFLADETIKTDAGKSYVTFQPLGVVLGIMPWNFPFWQVFRFAAPTLMAGNTILLKHSSNVSGCALSIESILMEAGFPAYTFLSIFIPGSAAAPLIAHPLIRAVSLTGSATAGKAVAAAAGTHLKKCVLELGGSDPYVVLADADLDATVESCATAKLINGGQSCIAAKRFIVVKEVYNDFLTRFIELMKTKRMGDPTDPQIDLGPLARTDLRDELHRQVLQSVREGARLLLGGTIPEMNGAYYPVTALGGVKEDMTAFKEELFGPVATIVSAEDESDAVRLANLSPFGLGAAVFTKDTERGERIARDLLQAGSCFVNAYVKSDPRLPFGGIKESGYGRELALFGIRQFVNVKSIYIK
jgi:succinate-semialdehyde dehydrogenase/glutarate-semialdehyde dehydrogenase